MGWKNVQYKNGKYRTHEGGGGESSALADLTDVNLLNPSDGDMLIYDGQNNKWVNISGGEYFHVYSTTEKRVGTWVDGSPIYERTFLLQETNVKINGSSFLSISIPFSNGTNYIIKHEESFNVVDKATGNDDEWEYPTHFSSFSMLESERGHYSISLHEINLTDNTILLEFHGYNYTVRNILSGHIIFQYTKTTD